MASPRTSKLLNDTRDTWHLTPSLFSQEQSKKVAKRFVNRNENVVTLHPDKWKGPASPPALPRMEGAGSQKSPFKGDLEGLTPIQFRFKSVANPI